MSYTRFAFRASWLSFILILFSIFSSGILAGQEAPATSGVDGKNIFIRNCKSCHLMERDMTGPKLDGSFERIQNAKGFSEQETMDWLQEWIPNAPAVIQSGDPYAQKLYNEYGTMMSAMPYLSEEEVEGVIDYIRNWDTDKYQDAVTAEGPQPPGEDEGGLSTNLLLLILVIVLILIALVLSRITAVLGRIEKEKEGKELSPEVPFYLNRKFLGVITMLIVLVAGYYTVEAAIGLGRQQGYQPDQPINYNHKLHAGLYEIDCKYCHVGAERGKNAVIPSVNICMNCHKFIDKGPTEEYKTENNIPGPAEDTTEIAKIYAAAGYDPETQTYDKSKAKPVKWVRIHNLPDHVYFSHAQHVKVGQIDCQECHGPIQEMDVVEQWAPLTMGWCLNCHRNTDVQFDQNEYYSEYYEEYHEQIKNGEIDGVTVDMIGGTDCQRCHY